VEIESFERTLTRVNPVMKPAMMAIKTLAMVALGPAKSRPVEMASSIQVKAVMTAMRTMPTSA
tara:strand:- start:297 stop:485 length:189 start_codon:yes stop_codon:yes gene_type:complete